MDEDQSLRRHPWEVKVTMGFLALLCLMEIQEGVLYLSREASTNRVGNAWTILLVLFFGAAVGIWMRSRIAWWMAVVVVGAIGLLHIPEALAVVTPPPEPPRSPGVVECAVRPPFERFRGFWLVVKNALLLAAPSLLLLGRLREKLRRPTP